MSPGCPAEARARALGTPHAHAPPSHTPPLPSECFLDTCPQHPRAPVTEPARGVPSAISSPRSAGGWPGPSATGGESPGASAGSPQGPKEDNRLSDQSPEGTPSLQERSPAPRRGTCEGEEPAHCRWPHPRTGAKTWGAQVGGAPEALVRGAPVRLPQATSCSWGLVTPQLSAPHHPHCTSGRVRGCTV